MVSTHLKTYARQIGSCNHVKVNIKQYLKPRPRDTLAFFDLDIHGFCWSVGLHGTAPEIPQMRNVGTRQHAFLDLWPCGHLQHLTPLPTLHQMLLDSGLNIESSRWAAYISIPHVLFAVYCPSSIVTNMAGKNALDVTKVLHQVNYGVWSGPRSLSQWHNGLAVGVLHVKHVMVQPNKPLASTFAKNRRIFCQHFHEKSAVVILFRLGFWFKVSALLREANGP